MLLYVINGFIRKHGSKIMHYIVTGGSGYIGSHMVALLTSEGHSVSILDNFSNSSQINLDQLYKICDKALVSFHKVDLGDTKNLNDVFSTILSSHDVDGVFHFAGLKSVGESSEKPLMYYRNNVGGTLNLLEVMKNHRLYKLVFSSSATVYGTPNELPINEHHPLSTTNPYGASKLLCEQMLEDIAYREAHWKIGILRYFNPVGAHESGLIGELPTGTPNNLMPYVFDVAIGKRDFVGVFGDNYDTKDGTGVRDYIHVQDLVEGHMSTLSYIEENRGVSYFNLGTGIGYSVLDMISATQRLTGTKVDFRIMPVRSGDVGSVYASTVLAEKLLKWKAKKNLDDMIEDQWRWTQTLSKL